MAVFLPSSLLLCTPFLIVLSVLPPSSLLLVLHSAVVVPVFLPPSLIRLLTPRVRVLMIFPSFLIVLCMLLPPLLVCVCMFCPPSLLLCALLFVMVCMFLPLRCIARSMVLPTLLSLLPLRRKSPLHLLSVVSQASFLIFKVSCPSGVVVLMLSPPLFLSRLCLLQLSRCLSSLLFESRLIFSTLLLEPTSLVLPLFRLSRVVLRMYSAFILIMCFMLLPPSLCFGFLVLKSRLDSVSLVLQSSQVRLRLQLLLLIVVGMLLPFSLHVMFLLFHPPFQSNLVIFQLLQSHPVPRNLLLSLYISLLHLSHLLLVVMSMFLPPSRCLLSVSFHLLFQMGSLLLH
mmetsp:Transcript_23430/g.55831  ORF Transcript_23430/g.55831 Transcript_23430/m.55831 type:complete len:342 (-) Transcript_23430:158-1183(-)